MFTSFLFPSFRSVLIKTFAPSSIIFVEFELHPSIRLFGKSWQSKNSKLWCEEKYFYVCKYGMYKKIKQFFPRKLIHHSWNNSWAWIWLTKQTLPLLKWIEIVFYHLIEIVLITWPNFFRLFTWSKVLIMISVKREIWYT